MTNAEYRTLQALALLRTRPSITILEIAAEMQVHRCTVAVYLDHLEAMGCIHRDTEHIVTVTQLGMEAEIPACPPTSERVTYHRNLPVERKHQRRGPSCKPWVNPLAGLTPKQREDAIVERDRTSRLAPAA
jgi:hypothetical protein